MAVQSVSPSFSNFTDDNGKPLQNGYLVVGAAGLNPEVNPIPVYWDAAMTIPAAQPIRTIAGYPHRNGTPARIYVNSDYSITVRDSAGRLVYSALSTTERYNAANVIFQPAGAGAVPSDLETILRNMVFLTNYGTDSAAFVAAQNEADYVFVPPGQYTADVVLQSGKHILAYGAELLGQVDCSLAEWSSIHGLNITPQVGDTFGMKWRKTRRCVFSDVNIGNIKVASSHPGDGLVIEGVSGAGTYYNDFSGIITGMTGAGVKIDTDDGEAQFAIGDNTFKSLRVHFCTGGGVLSVGTSNNTFEALTIEQCFGTILAFKKTATGTAYSKGNRILSLYSENPDKTAWLDIDASSEGTVINLNNPADGSNTPGITFDTIAASMMAAPGSEFNTRFDVWHRKIIHQVVTAFNIYGAAGDANPKMQISGSSIKAGAGGASAVDCTVGRQGAALWGTDNTTSIRAGDGSDAAHLRMGTVRWLSGTGSPNGVRVANVGAVYSQTDGGAGTSYWVKETGSGNTGWVSK